MVWALAAVFKICDLSEISPEIVVLPAFVPSADSEVVTVEPETEPSIIASPPVTRTEVPSIIEPVDETVVLPPETFTIEAETELPIKVSPS